MRVTPSEQCGCEKFRKDAESVTVLLDYISKFNYDIVKQNWKFRKIITCIKR